MDFYFEVILYLHVVVRSSIKKSSALFFSPQVSHIDKFRNILQNLTSKWTLVQSTGIIQMSLVLIVNGFYNPLKII